MKIKILQSIDECSSKIWDSLFSTDYPFLKHAFISLLESSGSVCDRTGWTPKHILLEQDGVPVATGTPSCSNKICLGVHPVLSHTLPEDSSKEIKACLRNG